MATSIRNARKSPTAPPHGFWSPLLIAGGVIVLLIVFSIVVLSLIRGGVGMTKEQAAMEQYLEKKYGQEFVVNKPIYTNSGFGVDGIWLATAHPRDDTSLLFDLDANKSTTVIYDQYVAAIWSREQSKIIQPEVERIYGSNSDTKVAVKIIFSGDLAKEATLVSPKFEEAKTDYADKGLYYEYTVNTPPSADTSTEAQKIYDLINIAKKNNIKKVGVSVVEERNGVQWVCNLGASKIDSMTNISEIESCISNKVRVEK